METAIKCPLCGATMKVLETRRVSVGFRRWYGCSKGCGGRETRYDVSRVTILQARRWVKYVDYMKRLDLKIGDD